MVISAPAFYSWTEVTLHESQLQNIPHLFELGAPQFIQTVLAPLSPRTFSLHYSYFRIVQ